MGWLGRATDYWMPRSTDAEFLLRARFAIQSWFIAWPMAVMFTTVSVTTGNWGQAAVNGLMVVCGPIALGGLKRTASLTPWVQFSLGCALVLFGPGTLVQSPFDETQLMYAVIIPLVAGFALGPASAARWAALTSVTMVSAVILGAHGYLLSFHDPTPLVGKSLNIISTLAMTTLFAFRFSSVYREALEHSQAANQAKSLFLASISHEIRTPMNGVLGMTELMLQETRDATSREQLEVIQRSGRSLVTLIDDLLDVTKLEAGKLTLDVTDFGLATLVKDVERLFTPRAKAKGLALQVELLPDAPSRLLGDPMRLRQVLTNLVSNAIKFTERGTVRLAVQREGGGYRFSVEDSGIGIAPEVMTRLFTVFEQGDASTTRRFGGTGLGLALCRQLVTLMGGELHVASKPGEGSRFWFVLSLPEAVGLPAPRPSVPPSSGKPRVLIVDDNAVNLMVATSLVRKAGFEVDAVSNGREAVEAASRAPYVAVLMDCHMPEMDGFEATERIRALPAPFGTVPVFALTASSSEEDLMACHRSGMRDVITKPVSMEKLQRVLGRPDVAGVAPPAATG